MERIVQANLHDYTIITKIMECARKSQEKTFNLLTCFEVQDLKP